MRKEIKTDRFLEGIQIRQRIIKEATGVDFTAVSTGFTRISTVRNKNASTARRIPSIKAMENPSTILPKLNPAECQKSPVKISSKSLRITETGDASGEETADPDAARVGALKGPTAMGMAQLLDADGYDFTIAASPDEIVPMVVQGNLDIAEVPANLAATLYQKTEKDVSVLAVNTLGVLYIVENGDSVKSVEDLKGKTIYASGKGATPEYALDSVLEASGIDPEKDVTIEYKSEHAEVVSALAQDQTAVGLLPQPFVTTALMKNDKLKVALDLNELWEASMNDDSRLVTGVVIAKNEFIKDHADRVDAFMDAYKESVDFVNSDTEASAQIIGDHDIIPKEVAQKAIPDCSIVFIEGDDMKTMLSGYLTTLNDQNPQIIGGQLPDDGFYYKR